MVEFKIPSREKRGSVVNRNPQKPLVSMLVSEWWLSTVQIDTDAGIDLDMEV